MGSREADDINKHSSQNPDAPLRTAQDRDTSPAEPVRQSAQEELEERRKIRRLQVMMNMVTSVISQDETLTVEEAAELVADSKKAALAMFPDKELAYNLIYKPRLQRLMRERYRIQ
ncbi:MAG TPA: hypothetical protein VGR96_00255 [Acidobacteriaceae bacterium]|nr:hypothetical protein [Acidobacteriaceae bacterium]